MSPGHGGEGGWSTLADLGGLHWFPWRCSWTWLVTQCPATSAAEVHGWESRGLVFQGRQSQCNGGRDPTVPLAGSTVLCVPWPWPHFSPGLDWPPAQVVAQIFTNPQGGSTNQSEQVLPYVALP